LVKELQVMYNNLPPMDKELFEFVKKPTLDVALQVEVRPNTSYIGADAMKYLRAFMGTSVAQAHADYATPPRQTLPADYDPTYAPRLVKTRYEPYSQQADARAPALGPYYQYQPHEYLPEENMGMYQQTIRYGLPSRFPMRKQVMMRDDRTRVPTGQ
jgi:hypothetical protein